LFLESLATSYRAEVSLAQQCQIDCFIKITSLFFNLCYYKNMKIGIFDSGLGGLIVTKAIRKMLPEYDFIYLGDTKRVPYGNRSHEAVFEFTRQGVGYLFRKENCAIVIIACNTASARALRRLQKEYLPPPNLPLHRGRRKEGVLNRKILGVLIPAAEEAAKFERVGILGTSGTISSGAFPKEIKKILARRSFSEGGNNKIKIFQNPAPMLVPMAEEGENRNAIPFIKKYLEPFADKKLDALVLGCTHYPIFKKEIKKILGKSPHRRSAREAEIKIISQDEIIPKKFKNYLARHPKIEKKLSKNKTIKILVTDITQNVNKLSKKWFGVKIKPKLIQL
jgi:glutamate racemase